MQMHETVSTSLSQSLWPFPLDFACRWHKMTNDFAFLALCGVVLYFHTTHIARHIVTNVIWVSQAKLIWIWRSVHIWYFSLCTNDGTKGSGVYHIYYKHFSAVLSQMYGCSKRENISAQEIISHEREERCFQWTIWCLGNGLSAQKSNRILILIEDLVQKFISRYIIYVSEWASEWVSERVHVLRDYGVCVTSC